MKFKAWCAIILAISPIFPVLCSPIVKHQNIEMTHIISDYRKQLASLPLKYSLQEKKRFGNVTLQRYALLSQNWSPHGMVSPKAWRHEVDIYIPDMPIKKHALVVVNDDTKPKAKASSDSVNSGEGVLTHIGEKQLIHIANATNSIIIAVSNIPNEHLTYKGNSIPLFEDDSVAYTWKLFMDDIQKYHNMPLHIPMSAAVSQALRLAKKELTQWDIDKFIVTGASKRGWIAWLTALSDPDVDAIVPFAINMLNSKQFFQHVYRTYGANWPIVLGPYYKVGIDQKINTEEFASLMTLEDPLAYLNSDFGSRFNIEKYLINASGDDFLRRMTVFSTTISFPGSNRCGWCQTRPI